MIDRTLSASKRSSLLISYKRFVFFTLTSPKTSLFQIPKSFFRLFWVFELRYSLEAPQKSGSTIISLSPQIPPILSHIFSNLKEPFTLGRALISKRIGKWSDRGRGNSLWWTLLKCSSQSGETRNLSNLDMDEGSSTPIMMPHINNIHLTAACCRFQRSRLYL